MRLFVNLLIAFVMAIVVGGGVSFATGLPAWGCVGSMMVLSAVPMPQGVAFMAIQKEIWTNHIQEELFKDNEFLLESTDASEHVMQGKVVHIPQAGQPSKVERNRSSLPANVTIRSDTDVTYALDEYTTDPIRIANADKAELSYDKRQSVLRQDQNNLKQTYAEWMLYKWGVGIETIPIDTGSMIDATVAGASGKRFSVGLDFLQKADTALTLQGAPLKGRQALVPASMVPQLFPINDPKTLTLFNSPLITKEERESGVIAFVSNFKIRVRQSALNFDGDTLKTPGSAVGADDCESIVCWHPDFVERAVGSIEAFEREKDPQFYGDIYSFLARAGGRQKRADHKGIVTIKQVVTS